MQPSYILESALYVDDLKKAEDFYTRIMGLKINSKKEGRHIFFNCGKGMLLIFNPIYTLQDMGEAPVHGSQGPGHLAFAINPQDFQKWKEHLVQNDIEVEKEIDWKEGGHSIYFRDPAGNSLELTTPEIWGIE